MKALFAIRPNQACVRTVRKAISYHSLNTVNSPFKGECGEALGIGFYFE